MKERRASSAVRQSRRGCARIGKRAAFKQAYSAWIEGDADQDLAQLSLTILEQLRATASALG